MAAHSLKATVLVAESDAGLRHLFRLLLRPQYEVVEVPSAAPALEMLRLCPEPVIALWDVWLSSSPGLHGSHVLDAIENEPAIRRNAFVLVTPELGAVSLAQRQQAQRLQIPLICMPFAVDLLLEQIAHEWQAAAERLQASN